MQVDDHRAGALDASRWLPDIREELAVGVGDGPEGHVPRPARCRHPGQVHRPAMLEHPAFGLRTDALPPTRSERPLETIVGGGHPGDVVRAYTCAERPGDHGES